MTKKDTGAEPENKESRSFRGSAMREPLFGSYNDTEEEGEKEKKRACREIDLLRCISQQMTERHVTEFF